MAFTLNYGAAYKTVNTEAQRDELIARGWTLAEGGTAGEAYDPHNYTDPTPRDFKGIGLEGEDPASIAYAAKKATEGVASQAQYEALNDIIHTYGDHVPPETFTKIETVAALPASDQKTATVYLLVEKDVTTGLKPGAYIYSGSKWVVYTIA